MNRSSFLPVAACAALALLLVNQAGTAQSSNSTEQQLLKLERAWSDAEINHDAAALEHVLDDGFVGTYDGGAPIRKREFIHNITGETLQSLEPSDATIIVEGDVAVIADKFAVRGTAGGKSFEVNVRVTATYIKRHGHWVVLAEQTQTLS